MTRILLLAGVLAPFASATAQMPPPVISTPAPAQRMLLAWLPGEARCGNEVVAGASMRRPWTALSWATPTTDSPKPVTYRFRIDEAGRPLSITRDGTDYIAFGDDIAPSLAASRFAPGVRTGCSVTYGARRTPLDVAPVEDLISYSLNPISGALPKEGWDRIRTAGATCLDDPRPQALTQVFPDFRALPGTAGVRDWTMIGFDQDAKGKPIHIRVTDSTRNAALDAAAVKAIGASRYTGGARTGCRYPYWRAPEKMPAPPMPEEAAFRPAGTTCPEPRQWATKPVLRFPDAYRKRSVEGWAIVRYDIAPWGEIGNAQVLAAEPTDDFGRQAIQVIGSAKVVPLPAGATGCIDRVRFVMGPVRHPDTEDTPPPPF